MESQILRKTHGKKHYIISRTLAADNLFFLPDVGNQWVSMDKEGFGVRIEQINDGWSYQASVLHHEIIDEGFCASRVDAIEAAMKALKKTGEQLESRLLFVMLPTIKVSMYVKNGKDIESKGQIIYHHKQFEAAKKEADVWLIYGA